LFLLLRCLSATPGTQDPFGHRFGVTGPRTGSIVHRTPCKRASTMTRPRTPGGRPRVWSLFSRMTITQEVSIGRAAGAQGRRTLIKTTSAGPDHTCPSGAFLRGFAIASTVSMKSRAIGLSVRRFRTTIAVVRCIAGRRTGSGKCHEFTSSRWSQFGQGTTNGARRVRSGSGAAVPAATAERRVYPHCRHLAALP
jgi:hypothetical protein